MLTPSINSKLTNNLLTYQLPNRNCGCWSKPTSRCLKLSCSTIRSTCTRFTSGGSSTYRSSLCTNTWRPAIRTCTGTLICLSRIGRVSRSRATSHADRISSCGISISSWYAVALVEYSAENGYLTFALSRWFLDLSGVLSNQIYGLRESALMLIVAL